MVKKQGDSKAKLPRYLLAIVALIMCFPALVGCSITGDNNDPEKSKNSIEQQVLSFIPDGTGVVPYVKGLKADIALQQVAAYGLIASVEDYSSLRRQVEYEADWTIVSQPEPGMVQQRGASIKLYAMNLSDTFEFLGDIESLKKLRLTESDVVLPNLRGMNLSSAKKVLDELGLDEYSSDASPKDRSIFADSSWVVVDQSEPSGSVATNGRTIMLKVLKTGEKYKPAIKERTIHWQEGQWYGKITGNSEERSMFSSGLNYVQIDGLDFELDLIDTIDESCQVENLDEIAQAEKVKLLPIGTKVRVVQTSSKRVVLHVVASDNLGKPLENSVQEQLVKTGYWVPSGYGTDGGDLGSDPDGSFQLDATGYYTGLTYKYLERLTAVANEVRVARVGGMNNCFLEAKAYVKEMAQMKAYFERQQREYERSHPWLFGGWGGGGSCADGSRDGDGDGICHER